MAMAVPSWLYYLFGVLMLAVAAYCFALLVLGALTRRPAGRDVEISHLFMGMAMAGMFVGSWSFGRSTVWEIIFAVLMVWFLTASIQSVQRYGLHLPHALVHAVMNFAMLLMYWFPMASASSGGMSMSSSSGGGRLDPGLALVLALALCASAVFTLASPVKGRTHFGSHAPLYAMTGPVATTGPQAGSAAPDRASSPVVAIEEVVATPWLVDLSHVAMCVAMAFMLILLT
jgi:hypothetical protein